MILCRAKNNQPNCILFSITGTRFDSLNNNSKNALGIDHKAELMKKE